MEPARRVVLRRVLSYDAAESAPCYVRYKDDGLEQNETLAAADFGRGWWLKKTRRSSEAGGVGSADDDDHDMTEAEADRRAAEEGLVPGRRHSVGVQRRAALEPIYDAVSSASASRARVTSRRA